MTGMNSVNFYENVNRLQEVIERSENHRMDLNREFVAALQSGDTRDKRRVLRIQSYFKQLCENERRSRDRNIKLLQDIERIEKNMDSLSRKTDRLRNLKRQYEDYVGRLYPNWREDMQKEINPKENGEVLASPKLTPKLSKSPVREIRTPPAVIDTRSRSTEELFGSKPSLDGSVEVPPLHLSALRSTSSTEKNTPDFPTMSSTGDALTGRSEITAITPMTGKPTLESKREQRVSFDMSTLKKALDSDEDEDEEDDEFSVPLTSSRTSTSRPETVMKVEIQSNGKPSTDPDEEAALKSLSQNPPTESSQDLNASFNSSAGGSRPSSSGGFAPSDLTCSGLFSLLQFVEDELERRYRDRSKLGMFYRSSLPAASLASEIKSLANEGGSLMHLNPISVSMVVIEELPHIVAAMHSGALLTDVILIDFANSPTTFDESMLISRLPDTKTMICKRLVTHLKALVHYKVMKPQEVAEAFGSCLINWHSRLEDKAIELLVTLVEGVPVGGSTTDETPSITPRASMGRAPSVSDTKPLGDSLMATAGSFHEMSSLKVTSNPELRSTESDHQLRFLKNALRAREESDEEEEDEEDEEEGLNKHQDRNPSISIPNDSDSEFDVVQRAPQKSTPFMASSIQSPAASASLKDSDAYKMMVGKPPARRQSSISSDEEDLDAMLGPVAQPSTLPSVQEGESPLASESHGHNDSASQSPKRNTPGDIARSTQELLRSVNAKGDSDSDLEIEYPGQPKPRPAETKTMSNNDDDDDFYDFYT